MELVVMGLDSPMTVGGKLEDRNGANGVVEDEVDVIRP